MPPVTHSVNVASIDVGSHTLRLLIASCKEKQELFPLHVDRRITRLARGFQEDRTLKEAGIRASIGALKEYNELLEQHHVRSVICGATGVVRRALNRSDFLKTVLEETRIRVSIISEDSEAFLSAKGVLSSLPRPEIPVLIFDLGGSSTEFVLADPQQPRPLLATSVFIGAATVTERFLRRDPPDENSVAQAVQFIHSMLTPPLNDFKEQLNRLHPTLSGLQVVGTAGTVTTLAAMHLGMEDYQPYRINGLRLNREWLADTTDLLARLTLVSRKSLPGLEEGREDIIFGGILIVREILRLLKQPSLTVMDAGLLEGLLLDHIEGEYGIPQTLWSPLTWHWKKG